MTLADVLDAELKQLAAGTARPCGQQCTDDCHGQLTCERATHPHDADNTTPHLGHTDGGALIQWVCGQVSAP